MIKGHTRDVQIKVVQVTYPGSNNFSTFVYDALSRNVSIVETTAGSVTSTKQFVWGRTRRLESRDGTGTILAQYFESGETISGSSYFWTRDRLGSVYEVTNGSGVIQSQYRFDPFGRVVTISAAVTPDLGFCGYFTHARSGLSLAVFRAYSAELGRWINRDPISEAGGVNLFEYAGNNTTCMVDPLGLFLTPKWGNWCGQGWANGRNESESDPTTPMTPEEGTKERPFVPPDDSVPEDFCCWQHDKCIRDAAKNNRIMGGARQKARCKCDNDMAACAKAVQNILPWYHVNSHATLSGFQAVFGGSFFGWQPNNNQNY